MQVYSCILGNPPCRVGTSIPVSRARLSPLPAQRRQLGSMASDMRQNQAGDRGINPSLGCERLKSAHGVLYLVKDRRGVPDIPLTGKPKDIVPSNLPVLTGEAHHMPVANEFIHQVHRKGDIISRRMIEMEYTISGIQMETNSKFRPVLI